ncbi:MAG TPA: bacteriohemerythrin [Armatimonadota bacterium]|jgi:hemerythrin
MALFTWSSDWSVGVPSIDLQHQKLIDLMNELHEAMRTGKGGDQIAKTLKELVGYTLVHFGNEERLMKAHAYGEYERHKGIHDDLVATVKELQQKVLSGNAFVTIQVMNMLKDWLANHIRGEDQKLGPYLTSQGVA